MLHELLFALNGYPGGIFILNDQYEIQVAKDLAFIHESEVALFNRVCRIGTLYYKLQQFIKQHGSAPRKGDGQDGFYIRALCEGLDQVLNSYRQALVDLEKEILADPYLSVTHVQTALEQYQTLFPALCNVIDQITSQKLYGCHILEVLYNTSANGMPSVQTAMLRILHVCHGVFYKQLSSWMLHGILLDQHKEFFIERQTDSRPTSTLTNFDEEDLNLPVADLQQILQSFDLDSQKMGSVFEFGLRAEMLPGYIPVRIAEKILFVGESVQMFESEKGNQFQHRGSILQDEGDEFAKEIHSLSQDVEFDIMRFESVIDKIRLYVSEQLWKLIVEKSDLRKELRIVKDFYLLGRGELFLAFIDKSKGLLKVPASQATQHDVNMAFQHAARDVLIQDDELVQKFNFNIPASSDKADGKKGVNASSGGNLETGWSTLSLKYSVDWPLHILLTPPIIERYNTLFRFLLYIKYIQLELQQCWANQMHQQNLVSSPSSKNKWWLRNHMAFLIDNLQYYLQVDVIESQFSILMDKIQSTKDFETVRYAHENFLTSLLGQSFLLMKPIANCLTEILKLCYGFTILVSHTEDTITEREEKQLASIAKGFQRQSNLLFMILSSVRSHQASPHLAQLLLRIDFNKYFSNCGGQLGSMEPVSVDNEAAPPSRRN